MNGRCEDVIDGKVGPNCARVVLQHHKWAADVEDRGKFGDALGVQSILPPPMPVDGVITLDRNNPQRSAEGVAAVFEAIG